MGRQGGVRLTNSPPYVDCTEELFFKEGFLSIFQRGDFPDWCSVKILDTDFVEFPSIKSVSFLSKLPFWQQNVFCNTFSHIQTENDIRNNYGFSWCCNMHQCIRIRVDMHDCNC